MLANISKLLEIDASKTKILLESRKIYDIHALVDSLRSNE